MLNISDFPWAECSITENRVMDQTDSLSLKRSKRSTDIMRYEFELVTIDMDMNQGRSVQAQLSAATDDIITFIHPRLSYALGVEPSNGVETVGISAAGTKQINITGFGQPWSLKAGDYIQTANDTKVYQVAADVTYGTGSRLVTLTSALRTTIADGTDIIMNDITWYLTSNGIIDVKMEASENQDMQITQILVEQL